MKLQLGKLFLELRESRAKPNSFSIRFGESHSHCKSDVGVFAESFDSALSFYIELLQKLTCLSGCCWFETRTWRAGRLQKAIGSNVLFARFYCTRWLLWRCRCSTTELNVQPVLARNYSQDIWNSCATRCVGARNRGGAGSDEL